MTNDRSVTGIRRRLTEIENDLVDELTSRADRPPRIPAPRLGAGPGHAAALDLGRRAGRLWPGCRGLAPAARAAKPGGTIRAATSMPAGAIDPVTVDDNQAG